MASYGALWEDTCADEEDGKLAKVRLELQRRQDPFRYHTCQTWQEGTTNPQWQVQEREYSDG
eukprot:gene27008-biopygen802